jgi:hypothetical protein
MECTVLFQTSCFSSNLLEEKEDYFNHPVISNIGEVSKLEVFLC